MRQLSQHPKVLAVVFAHRRKPASLHQLAFVLEMLAGVLMQTDEQGWKIFVGSHEQGIGELYKFAVGIVHFGDTQAIASLIPDHQMAPCVSRLALLVVFRASSRLMLGDLNL
jgi:ATP-dependent Clp protease adapter protein ClpS